MLYNLQGEKRIVYSPRHCDTSVVQGNVLQKPQVVTRGHIFNNFLVVIPSQVNILVQKFIWDDAVRV